MKQFFSSAAFLFLFLFAVPGLAQNTPDKVIGTKAAEPAAAANADPAQSDADGTKNGSGDKVWSTADIAQPAAAEVKRAFEGRFPGIQVDSVRVTPMGGIYEVQIGMDLVYTDAAVNYVLQGSLIDAKARRDLTAERLEDIQQLAYDALPMDHAIRIVKGSGARKMATFEDPNCPYCKKLHESLAQIDDVTIDVFLFPILSQDSLEKARDIWCAEDPAAAWKNWMISAQAPEKAECETPFQDNLELGRKLGVQGTPAMFFADGTRVNGALSAQDLEAALDLQSAAAPVNAADSAAASEDAAD